MKARTEAGGKFNNIENNEGLKLNIDVNKLTDNSLYNVAALLLWHKASSRWYAEISPDVYQNVNIGASDVLRIGERYVLTIFARKIFRFFRLERSRFENEPRYFLKIARKMFRRSASNNFQSDSV